MKLKRISLALAAASLGVTHAATLCGESGAAADPVGLLESGAGDVTLGSTLSLSGNGGIGGGLVAAFASTSPVSAVAWLSGLSLPGSNAVGRLSVLSSSSVFQWDLGATNPNSGRVRDSPVLIWDERFPQSGSVSPAGSTTNPSWESVFTLGDPNTLTWTVVPEPSSGVISSLLVAAGLLRRRRVA